MREMKASGIEWIGEIPKEWDVCLVKRNYDIVLGKMLQPAAKSESDELCQYLCAANISWNGIDTSIEKKMWFSPKEKEIYKLIDGDLLVTEGGDVAVSSIWHDEITDCFFQNALHRTRGKGENTNRYLFYWLQVLKNTGYIDLICNKATLAHFTKEKLGDCPIPYIDGQLQLKIADYLDKKCAEIDALIAAKEKTNALLKERRQSIIYEAVTKGLDPTAPMKDSGIEWIGMIPEDWNVERLKFHIDFNPSTVIPKYIDSDMVSFLPMECLKSGTHSINEAEYKKVKKGYVIFQEGDILMAKVTPCLENGNLAVANGLADGVGFGSTEINVIRCKDINREYLFYILQTPTFIDKAVSNMYGVAGLKRLAPDFIPNTFYPIPPIDTQKSIVDSLIEKCAEFDSIIKSNESTIEKLKEYRQSVIYEAVTGKVEV